MCSGCNKVRKQTMQNADPNNPASFKKSVYEFRKNICRKCSNFKPTLWLCLINSKDIRQFCKVMINTCPLPMLKW